MHTFVTARRLDADSSGSQVVRTPERAVLAPRALVADSRAVMRPMIWLSAVLLAALVPGCGNGDFKDCAVSCSATTGCPDGFTCSNEGLCRIAGAFGECGDNPFPDAPEQDADPGGSTRFDFTGDIDSYVVPAGVTQIHLVVTGASGGDTGTFVGGFGAIVDTNATVTPGETLSIIVGQQPIDQVAGSDGCGASGGGGSFVLDADGDPLAVAGGGGGASGFTSVMMDGGDASISTSGRSTTVAGGTGGSGGSGISGVEGGGGGGGGVISSGGAGMLATGGRSFALGAVGGARDSTESCGTTAAGGFGGGGGGGRDAGAGGGGYSGGAARDSMASTVKAGGGGSFGLGSPDISIRTTHGHGSVVITPL
jgi:hypothetical protein